MNLPGVKWWYGVAFVLAAIIFASLKYVGGPTTKDGKATYLKTPSITEDSLVMAKARIECFAASMPVWLALFAFCITHMRARLTPLMCAASFIVLVYLSFEVHGISRFSGEFKDTEGGETELPAERSIRLSTVAFAMGTLLVSQKNEALVKTVAPLIFLSLLFVVLPSLATGAAAKQRAKNDPYFAAIQRVSLTMGGGVLLLSLAQCVSETLISVHG